MDIRIEVLGDVEAANDAAAAHIAAAIAASSGPFALALSGGTTPARMFRTLAASDLEWSRVGIWQVDERIAPLGSGMRSLELLRTNDIGSRGTMHPMPVEEPDLVAAAASYGDGLPGAFDLVHLGLGDDGHIGSLVPGDPVCDITDRAVGLTGDYRDSRRMTLTFPTLDRAREVVFLVTGERKREMIARLLAADTSIPAGRLRAGRAVVFADRAAGGDR